jgi:sugar lactone lactonase YvrE
MTVFGRSFFVFLLSFSFWTGQRFATAQPFLFVANAGNNTIYQYTSNGVASLFANTNLSNPQALAFDGAGNLYVANNGNNTIVKFSPGGVGSVFASSGLSGPVGLAFDAAGNLYAANQNNGTIEKFSPSGVGTNFASGLSAPGGLAFDSASNLFVVADSSVYKITPAGVRTTFATGFSSPTFLAFDGAGNLYVGEYGNADIRRFTPGGVGSLFASSGINYPYQMAFDVNSNLYVINHYGNNVESFTPAGVGGVFTSSGINGPDGIAINTSGLSGLGPQVSNQPANQTVLAGGTATFSVTATGMAPLSYQWSFNGTNINGATTTSLVLSNVQPSQAGNYTVAVSNAINSVVSSNALLTVVSAQPFLYVANAGNNTIYQYTGSGLGSLFANTNLSNPQALVFDDAGNLFVANNGNNTIAKFTPGGIGSVFASNGLSGPVGLAFDKAGNLYAANQNNGTIEKFSPSGVGTNFATGFDSPGGLVFDGASNLFVVADSSVYKIAPGGVRTAFATGFSSPTFLAIDGTGNIYVGEYGNADIKQFTPWGEGSLFASSGINYPYQMAFDTNGNLFVVNHYGNNVESFAPEGVGSVFATSGINGPNGIAIVPGQAPHRSATAVNISASTQQNKPIILPVEKVLASAINFDAVPISLSALSVNSTNGGAVGISTNSVIYNPVPNFTGADQFTYTITDGNGGISTASVFVQVQPGTGPSKNMLPLTAISGGYIVGFVGIPGRTYAVQRAPSVNGPWAPLATVLVGPSGIASFTDTNSPPEGAYYRVAYQ